MRETRQSGLGGGVVQSYPYLISSPGQRPGKTFPQRRALKEALQSVAKQSNGSKPASAFCGNASEIIKRRPYSKPCGATFRAHRIRGCFPRALPWATMFEPFGQRTQYASRAKKMWVMLSAPSVPKFPRMEAGCAGNDARQ